MTAAFNLAQLANNLNNTGQLDASDGLIGVVPVANGGTGASTAANARINLDTINASNLSTGTVAVARLGSGTANSSTFLRGDGTWAEAIPPGSSGSNGTYAFLVISGSFSGQIVPGTTFAGSSLRYSGFYSDWDMYNNATSGQNIYQYTYTAVNLSGTWRLMATGALNLAGYYATGLFVRIS
jgi:hypothetical protein